MRQLLVVSATAVGFSLSAVTAWAQPSVPGTFYGSVTVDGAPAPDGVEVRAIVNGQDCSQPPPGTRLVIRDGQTSEYVLSVVHETQRPGCARDGATVSFTIAGRTAVQTGIWKPGPVHLDLSVGAAPPIPLPSPTGTIGAILATETAGALPTPSASLVRPTGTPPTDDVTFDRTPVPPGATPGEQSNGKKENSGPPVLMVTVTILVALGAIGAGAGFALSRRRPPGA